VRKGCLVLLTMILLLTQAALLSAAALKNVTADFADNRVLFKYDLDGSEREAEVSIRVTVLGQNNGSVEQHFEGDLGKVKTGAGKKILWDVLKDYPRGLNAEIDWEIWADKALVNPAKGVWGRIQINISPVRR
jgi:hypothetical protein